MTENPTNTNLVTGLPGDDRVRLPIKRQAAFSSARVGLVWAIILLVAVDAGIACGLLARRHLQRRWRPLRKHYVAAPSQSPSAKQAASVPTPRTHPAAESGPESKVASLPMSGGRLSGNVADRPAEPSPSDRPVPPSPVQRTGEAPTVTTQQPQRCRPPARVGWRANRRLRTRVGRRVCLRSARGRVVRSKIGNSLPRPGLFARRWTTAGHLVERNAQRAPVRVSSFSARRTPCGTRIRRVLPRAVMRVLVSRHSRLRGT